MDAPSASTDADCCSQLTGRLFETNLSRHFFCGTPCCRVHHNFSPSQFLLMKVSYQKHCGTILCGSFQFYKNWCLAILSYRGSSYANAPTSQTFMACSCALLHTTIHSHPNKNNNITCERYAYIDVPRHAVFTIKGIS